MDLQKSRTLGKLADTGWEPRAVYENLARLRTHAKKFGIPVRTVSAGNIRNDALDPAHRFVSMPLHVLNPDGTRGLARRQCTGEYKITPLKKAARHLLGYPHPQRVPRGMYIEQAIGISTDEITRAKDSGVQYLRNVFPLIELGWDRARCVDYLAEHGFEKTVKSACVGCPFHGNAGWRWIRDNDPDGWTEAVEFDRAIRDGYPHATKQGQPLRGQYFLHRSCRPLDQADLDPPAAAKRHLRVVTTSPTDEQDDPDGCSPWGMPLRHPAHRRACGMNPRPRAQQPAPRNNHALTSAPADRSAWPVWTGLLVVAAYIASVVMANWASTHCPPWLIGSLLIPAGTVWAGVTLTLRDLLHETLGLRGALGAVAAGVALSSWVATPQIAAASMVAFAASEIIDTGIYARLRRRSRLGAVLASNLLGLLADSVLFVPLAFGTFAAVPGQILGKTVATVGTVVVLLVARTLRARVARR